jgi:hypothetical protein
VLRDAFAAHADVADARGQAWLGARPPLSHIATARHVLAMMAVYLVTVVFVLIAIAGFITVATG